MELFFVCVFVWTLSSLYFWQSSFFSYFSWSSWFFQTEHHSAGYKTSSCIALNKQYIIPVHPPHTSPCSVYQNLLDSIPPLPDITLMSQDLNSQHMYTNNYRSLSPEGIQTTPATRRLRPSRQSLFWVPYIRPHIHAQDRVYSWPFICLQPTCRGRSISFFAVPRRNYSGTTTYTHTGSLFGWSWGDSVRMDTSLI